MSMEIFAAQWSKSYPLPSEIKKKNYLKCALNYGK